MSLDYSQYDAGWIDDPAAVAAVLSDPAIPLVSGSALAGSGEGKVVNLAVILDEIRGKPYLNRQTIGDCVSHGWSRGVDTLKAVQVKRRETASYTGDTATEVVYAGSRVEVGGGRIGGDGSVGAWAAKLVSTYGTLPRGRYGSIDLTTYDGSRARQWGRGRAGIPDELEPAMKDHVVKSVTLVTTYDQARDHIVNGDPVAVCSNRGFAMRRDSEGFCRPQGSWPHCMVFVGVIDSGPRKGLLCANSWGDYLGGPATGPDGYVVPAGAFLVDAETADRMLRAGDSFAMSAYQGGSPVNPLDYSQY